MGYNRNGEVPVGPEWDERVARVKLVIEEARTFLASIQMARRYKTCDQPLSDNLYEMLDNVSHPDLALALVMVLMPEGYTAGDAMFNQIHGREKKK